MSLNMVEVWTEFEEAVNLAWPDIATGYTAIQGARKNWRDQLAEGKLTPPFAVIRAMPARPLQGRSIGCFGQVIPIELTYVRAMKQTTAEASAESDVQWIIETKCRDAAMYFHDGIFDTFLVPDDPTWDAGDTTEANDSILKTGAPYLSGTVYMAIEVHDVDG